MEPADTSRNAEHTSCNEAAREGLINLIRGVLHRPWPEDTMPGELADALVTFILTREQALQEENAHLQVVWQQQAERAIRAEAREQAARWEERERAVEWVRTNVDENPDEMAALLADHLRRDPAGDFVSDCVDACPDGPHVHPAGKGWEGEG